MSIAIPAWFEHRPLRSAHPVEVTYRNPAQANVANISRLRLWVILDWARRRPINPFPLYPDCNRLVRRNRKSRRAM